MSDQNELGFVPDDNPHQDVGFEPDFKVDVTAPAEHSLAGFAVNVMKSGGHLVSGLVHLVRHPVDSARALGGAGVGAVNYGLKKAGLVNEAAESPELKHSDAVASALADYFKGRYGSMDAVKNAMYEDPVGVLADASTVIGGGAGLLKGAGTIARVAGAADTASRVGTAAEVLTKAGELANPLAVPGRVGAATLRIPAVQGTVAKVLSNAPRPLSPGALKMAEQLGIPLTSGMKGGSKMVQAAEKLLGHTVAPDVYEPILETANQGLQTGANKLAGGFGTDRFAAGDSAAQALVRASRSAAGEAQNGYELLAKLEEDPALSKSVQNGLKKNASPDPTAPELVPEMEQVPLPVDMRRAKELLKPVEEEFSRRMTPAQREGNPGLTAIRNILDRPDYLRASVAEADLGYLKSILRSNAPAQSRRLASEAIDALDGQIRQAVSQAGPDAMKVLEHSRDLWKRHAGVEDLLEELTGATDGKSGQVKLASKLLAGGDAEYPALQKVLAVAPEAAEDLGKAYLTDNVFKKAAAGEDLTPKQASNLWNQIGPRTKAALYTPEKLAEINDFLELLKRVGENPNPSGTGVMNALMKAGAVVVKGKPGGIAGLALGRKVAQVLFDPEKMQELRDALSAPTKAPGFLKKGLTYGGAAGSAAER